MLNNKTTMRRVRGFSLIELLVVLVILGLLAGLVGPRVVKYIGGAKTSTAKTQIENLASTLEMYRLEVGRYPTTAQGLDALNRDPGNAPGWNGPYLAKQKDLKDPWGAEYQYRFPGEHGEFDVFSYGADGSPGGEGENADVVSWE